MKFKDIPKFLQAHYEIHVSWKYMEDTLSLWSDRGHKRELQGGLNMNPDYQRGHVWTREQQIKFVEYGLMGGEVGKVIIFNCPDWGDSYKSPVELVDGKQRIEAVRAFLRNEIPAFGFKYSEFEDKMGHLEPNFEFRVCKIKTRSGIIQLYLSINAGGTPHSQEELERVNKLLISEMEKEN